MGEEPGRDRYTVRSSSGWRYAGDLTSDVGLSIEGLDVRLIALLNTHVAPRLGSFIIAVVGPRHPVEQTIHAIQVGTHLGMKVGGKEDGLTGGGAHGVDIQAIASERRDKDLAVDLQLRGQAGVLRNLLAQLVSLLSVVPIEVEGNEHLHAIISRRLVGEIHLPVRVGINTNVQGKSINTEGFGTLHVIVVIRN